MSGEFHDKPLKKRIAKNPRKRHKQEESDERNDSPSSFDESPWIKLHREKSDFGRTKRQDLIKSLEDAFQVQVITYFATFKNIEGSLEDLDVEMLENLLSAEHSSGGILLIINAPGGNGLAAERMVNVCRAYSKENFETLVPHMAKSAATMVCFGSNKIHMSATAELGPVDPQIGYMDDSGNAVRISADEFLRSYDTLMEDAQSPETTNLEPYLLQLHRYDSRHVEQVRSAKDLAEKMSIKLLQSNMMKGKTDEQIRDEIRVFLSQEETRSHGRMISLDEAKKCGLIVESIELQTQIWHQVWDLFVRSDDAVNSYCMKMLESATTSLTAGSRQS